MKFFGIFLSVFLAVASIEAQQRTEKEFDSKIGASIVVKNFYGRVNISAEEAQGEKISLRVASPKTLAESELQIKSEAGRVRIEIAPKNARDRVDVSLKIPLRSKVRVETDAGEVQIVGNVESAEVSTDTGTISTDVPLDALKFDFLWLASRPRYLSDVELAEEVKEKSGGRFSLSGKLGEAAEKKKEEKKNESKTDEETSAEAGDGEKSDSEKDKPKETLEDKKRKAAEKKLANKNVRLDFSTERGIILLNVAPSDVPSNLQERQLTEAAKAIVRGGDSTLVEAIRRASPKFFGDYLKTLPPRRFEPSLAAQNTANRTGSAIKQLKVKVTDADNRAVGDLRKEDFVVTEAGAEREILSVEKSAAPFNLVLLLDVSGSIDNYVDFIRKTARNFVNTMNPEDKISILIFNENIKQISAFTTDRSALSESLDTFDAGGGTAYYDALAFTLVETLKPLRGEPTAVIVLTDGDDNRSFLTFDSLLGSIQESGALIYPLYVPSELIAASKSNNPVDQLDPLRSRYMALTTKSENEGSRLAEVSGGVYYPIRRIAELQAAYDDIVRQLRTAYTITYRSNPAEISNANTSRSNPRLKVAVKRENLFVKLDSVVGVK